MIVCITGTNRFAMKRRLDELVDKFVAKHGDLALERIEADEADTQAIIDSLQSVPFLSDKKMVILYDLAANKQAGDAIEQIIDAAKGSVEVIIYDTQLDKRTAYFKKLSKQTQLEEFNELAPPALASWLVAEAKRQKAELSHADAVYLVSRAGTDQLLLYNELVKLITYEPKVSRENIDLLTEPVPQSRIFDLLDAAFGGDKKKALKIYQEQRAQKVEPQAIMAMIAWQLHLLSVLKYSKDRPASKVASDLKMNPYPVSKAAGMARKITRNKLQSLTDDAFSIDWKSKTSAVDLDEALKTYITTM